MGFTEFAQHMQTIGLRYRGSCISWGRSKNRNEYVEGHEDSLHMSWLACDMVFDTKGDMKRAGKHAIRQGIWWKRNGDLTIHFQALHPPKV